MHEDDANPAPTIARRRMHAAEPRDKVVTIRFNAEELAVVKRRAAAFGMATSAYIGATALAGAMDPGQERHEIGFVDERRQLLRALLIADREFRRARAEGHGPVVEAVADQIGGLLLELTRELSDERGTE
jgi:hypothetical protein